MGFQSHPAPLRGCKQGPQIQVVTAHCSTARPARSGIKAGNAMSNFLIPLDPHAALLLHDPRVRDSPLWFLCGA